MTKARAYRLGLAAMADPEVRRRADAAGWCLAYFRFEAVCELLVTDVFARRRHFWVRWALRLATSAAGALYDARCEGGRQAAEPGALP